jgi:predicted branched-subunit amino acid permease
VSATTAVAPDPVPPVLGRSGVAADVAPDVAPVDRASRPVWEGVRDITPMVIGVIPFALAIGAAVGSSSLTRGEGVLSGPVILAGAAQLSVVQMLDAGAAPLVIVLSALMINARLLLYSASLAPWFRDEPLRHRLLLALPVIDQLHFTCTPRFERGDLDERGRRAYYVGAAVWLAGAWFGTQAVAIVVGANVPDAVGLDVAAPLALVGLLAKSTVDGRSVVAAIVAAAVATAAVVLPFHSAVLVGALVGIAAGVRYDDRWGAAEPAGPATATAGAVGQEPTGGPS